MTAGSSVKQCGLGCWLGWITKEGGKEEAKEEGLQVNPCDYEAVHPTTTEEAISETASCWKG